MPSASFRNASSLVRSPSSLPSSDASTSDETSFVPRTKPLRDIPERKITLYAHLRDSPPHIAECPHASEAYRGEIREHLYELDENHPGTRHSSCSATRSRLAWQARPPATMPTLPGEAATGVAHRRAATFVGSADSSTNWVGNYRATDGDCCTSPHRQTMRSHRYAVTAVTVGRRQPGVIHRVYDTAVNKPY